MPKDQERREQFRALIQRKYLIYNSLFTNLPNEGIRHTGIYLPLLQKLSEQYYQQGKSPLAVMEDFFANHTEVKSRAEEFDFLFRMVQYIERQVVLFDSVEDAAFADFNRAGIDAFWQKNELSPEQLDHFKSFGVRIVFTAHPTQFYPNAVQSIMHDLRKSIRVNDISQIDRSLQQLAFTPFVNHQKPSPYDEAKSIIFYLRYVYYQTLGRLYHRIVNHLGQAPDFNPGLLQLGFWPGGDRDGNPFVTADITRQVARELRIAVMKCYYQHLKWLMKKISFRETQAPLQGLKAQLYQQIFADAPALKAQDILAVLYEVRAVVKEHYQSLYLDELEDFIGRVHLFGSHFASLDIRQDSSIHRQVITSVLAQHWGQNWSALSDEAQINWLSEQEGELDPAQYEDPLLRDTLVNIRQLRTLQAENGPLSVHRYIISNTESLQDILSVYALFRWSGYAPEEISFDIVPLFETMEGMQQAPKVMKALYEHPRYSAHLRRRGQRQYIMLGFSDGTKDGGYLKANWEIHQSKERLTALSRQFGLEVIFFDGRGGPPARGGGKTHRFYAAQGPEIESKNIQLTIQGQTITSIFGTHDQASYNFEQLLLAGLKARESASLSQTARQLMQEMADSSYQKYCALKAHPLFTGYLEEMTPLKQYGDTNIGSRPTKRKESAGLELKDLRAIPFVGSWSMVRQNIPGYYGLGSALAQYRERWSEVEALYAESAFFRSLIDNSVMSMKKTYFPLTAYLAEHSRYGAFWQDLRQEYLLTKELVLRLTGQQELMENEPLARLSISSREKIILPLLSIQMYALQRMQAGDPDRATYEKLVIRCLFGNINASRNSA